MGIAILLAVVLNVVALAFFVRLAVHAFRTGLGWGLAFLFLPFASLVYAIKFWSEVRKPFLWWLGSSVAGTVVLFGAIGVQAARLATAAAERAAVDAASQPTDDSSRIDLVRRDAGEVAPEVPVAPARPVLDPDDVLARLPAGLRLGADDSGLATPLPGKIEIASAGRYVGSHMRVTDRDGLRLSGRLVEAGTGTLVIEKTLPQGSIEVELPAADVRSLELLGP